MESINWGATKELADYNRQQFEKFLEKTPEEIKRICHDENGRLKHILRSEHFNLEFLQTVCETANAARRISKLEDNYLKGLLRSKSILNYFSQPSSRTFLSFSTAESHLGMKREELRDLKTSSAVKGESDRDSLRTISSYFNAIVCRHPSDIYDLFMLWVMTTTQRELPIINSGSGTKEHPTQGLLDYYTIRESFNTVVDNRVILFVGDCKRGRTLRSLAKILALHKSMVMYFIAPNNLQIDELTEEFLRNRGVTVHKTDQPLKELVTIADVVYMTRIQNEHGGEQTVNTKYCFTYDMLTMMRENAILMHPMPKREEIDPKLDYSDDKRIMFWREQRNGMWTRVALLAYLFNVDGKIRDRFDRIKDSVAPKPL